MVFFVFKGRGSAPNRACRVGAVRRDRRRGAGVGTGQPVGRLEQPRHPARGLAGPAAGPRARRLRRPAGQRRRAPARRHLGRLAHHAARIPVPRASVRLRAELRGHPHLGGARLGLAAAHRHPHAPFRLGHRAHDLDGRPPASRPSTRCTRAMGFSTGKWDGDILTVTTTHLKEGWMRRNGLTRSDRATVTEHFIRHGDRLTLVTVVNDPVYYTEPVVRSARLRVRSGRRHRPVSVRAGRGDRSGRRARSRTTCPARTRSSTSIAKAHGVPLEARARRRRDDVSRVPEEDRGRRRPTGTSDAGHDATFTAAGRVRIARRGGLALGRRSPAAQQPQNFDNVADPHPAGAGQRLHAGRRRRQHHRAGRQGRRAARRHAVRAAVEQDPGGDPHAVAAARFATSSTRTSTAITSAATRTSRKAGATIAGGNVAGRHQRRRRRARRSSRTTTCCKRMSAPTGRQPPIAVGRVADEHVHRRRQEALLQRRRHPDHPPAGRAHRRRQHRVLPAVGRHQRRRHLHDDRTTRSSTSHAAATINGHHRRAEPRSSTSSSRSTARRAARWSSPATAACATWATSSTTARW